VKAVADSQITKRVLAEAIKELMAHKPLSKISVGDIAQQCGVNRQTFYYHFRDKYDLVNWIYYTETIEYIGILTDKDSWADGLIKLCNYMKDNKRFYINALNTPGQNSFPEYLTQYIHELVAVLFSGPLERGSITKVQHEVISDYYTFAIVGVISKWAKNGMKEPPEEFVGTIRDLTFPAFIERE
jgi:probable dihydroxyacetone kinase regulator